jgi:hypothetical protein
MTKRKAERRKALFRNRRALRHGARLAARSPLGVPPRHLRQRPNATAQLEPRDFRGLVRSARPDGSKDARIAPKVRDAAGPNGTRGRYPRLTVPVQRDCTRSTVMMPSGRVLPKPPESRGDEPRPAGTALAPPTGVTRPASSYGGEIRILYLIWRRVVKRSSFDRRRRDFRPRHAEALLAVRLLPSTFH